MDLRALLLVLWRKKWVLIVVPIFAVGAALVLRLTGEWKYKSTAQLATGLTVSDELIGNAKYLNPYEVQVTFNNLIETIKSRSVLGQLSYQLMMHDLKDSANAYRSPDKKRLAEKMGPGITSMYPDFARIIQSHVDSITLLNPNNTSEKQILTLIDMFGYDYETIQKELLIYRLNQSDFIEVTYTSENAQLSASVVNTLCSEFIRYYSSLKDTRSNASLESLTTITKQRKEFLDQKTEELQTFKANTDIVNAQVETETRMRQIEQYETQISETRQKVSALELTAANIAVRLNNQGSNASSQNTEIIGLKRRIDDLNAKYITGGQKDNVLLDTLTHLRAKMDALVRTGRNLTKLTPEEVATLRSRKEETSIELEIARENLSSLNNILGALRLKLGNFASKEAVGTALEKDVEVARQEYLASQTRLSEARDKIMTNTLSISQILMAEPAEKVESKKTLLFMIVSGVLSFMICAFVIITLELMDSRIRTGQRFKLMTRLKLAGFLPSVDVPKLNWDDIFTSEGNSRPTRLSEEMRKIRFEIDNHMARVILVTSVREGQGKSFFIIALAYSLGLLRKRVLIIDTNLRNNTLTRTFVVKNNLKLILENFATNGKLLKAGPSSGTSGNATEDEAPIIEEGLISKTSNPLIDIIGNKKSQLSPSEVIPKGDFKVLLNWLKNQYDYVILEGPSLDKFSDSKELLGFVDLVIPVFAADATVESKDTEALNFLKNLQGQLGPAVLNKVEGNS